MNKWLDSSNTINLDRDPPLAKHASESIIRVHPRPFQLKAALSCSADKLSSVPSPQRRPKGAVVGFRTENRGYALPSPPHPYPHCGMAGACKRCYP
jgi:hypothetical protein